MATFICTVLALASGAFFGAAIMRGIARHKQWDVAPVYVDGMMLTEVVPLIASFIGAVISAGMTFNSGIWAGLSVAVAIPFAIVLGIAWTTILVGIVRYASPRIFNGVNVTANAVKYVLSAAAKQPASGLELKEQIAALQAELARRETEEHQ